jgi:hypothetical protein
MKRNIRNLAVFVIIAAIAMFMVVAIASANDHRGKKTMNAKYAFAGSGNCLIAISGFNASLQPNDGANGMWFWGPVTLDEGIIKFNKDGTGSVTNILHAYDIWGPVFGAPPNAGAANETWDFTYTMTNSGNITITYTEGSCELDFTSGPNAPPSPLAVGYFILPPVKGVVSPDGKNLYVSYGAPDKYISTSDKENKNPTGMEAICSVVIQGFWISP